MAINYTRESQYFWTLNKVLEPKNNDLNKHLRAWLFIDRITQSFYKLMKNSYHKLFLISEKRYLISHFHSTVITETNDFFWVDTGLNIVESFTLSNLDAVYSIKHIAFHLTLFIVS